MPDPAALPPVLVGELNPFGGDPCFALYPLPEACSGGRLQRLVLGVPTVRYLDFPRHNLCAGKWSAPAARAEARRLAGVYADYKFVLLGAKVCAAFNVLYAPFESSPDGFVVLPHPSGLNRVWNDRTAFRRARDLMQREFPHIPFGTLT